MHMPRSSEAVFTAYIFKQDVDKLDRWTSSTGSVGGNLYGLWTSTGNPVIHVVDRSARVQESVSRNLEERYKMSHLGAWRSAAFGARPNENQLDRIANEMFAPGSKRFLALVVRKGAKITTTLFVAGQPNLTSMEELEGPNPFIDDLDTKSILEGTYRPAAPKPRSYQSRDEQHFRYERSSRTTVPTIEYSDPAHPRTAQTDKHQWYSGKKGEQDLHYVFEELKKVAHTEVQMNRDTDSQDFTMSFKRNGIQWQVEFSCSFPETGAKVVRVYSPTRTQVVADVRDSDFKRAVKDIVKEVRY